MTKYNWPTREEWAHRRQHPYWDTETGCPFADRIGHQLSDYATAEENAAAIAGLEQLWRQCGRRMRELKAKGSPLYQQPGENDQDYWRRWRAMSEADQDIAGEPDELKRRRHFIRKIAAKLRENKIPWRAWEASKEANALVVAFEQRYEAARKTAEEQWEREQLLNPIDDAAWEKELHRRKQIEDRGADDRAHPEKFIYNVPEP